MPENFDGIRAIERLGHQSTRAVPLDQRQGVIRAVGDLRGSHGGQRIGFDGNVQLVCDDKIRHRFNLDRDVEPAGRITPCR